MSDLIDEQVVPFQGKAVAVRRCGPADLLVLTDWCDLYLAGDFHFKRRHMHGILTRGTSVVWAILIDEVFAGLLVLYRGSTLHNLYIDPANRGSGVGTAILNFFKPAVIRAKRNMQAGDPVPFYAENGYQIQNHDPEKPHIAVMTRIDSLPVGEATPTALPTLEPLGTPAEPTDWLAEKRRKNNERSRRRRDRLKAARETATATNSPTIAPATADSMPAPSTDSRHTSNGHAPLPVFTYFG